MDYLKILDMTEDEQLEALNNLWQNRQLPEWFNLSPDLNGKIWMTVPNRHLLADLAFRLRDEAVQLCISWEKAKEDVWVYVCHKKPDVEISYIGFWTNLAQPIHWIAAALIATAEEQND